LYEEAFPNASPYGDQRRKLLAYLSTRALGKCGHWERGNQESLSALYQCLYTLFKTSLSADATSLEEGKTWLLKRGIEFDSLLVGKEVRVRSGSMLASTYGSTVGAAQTCAVFSLQKVSQQHLLYESRFHGPRSYSCQTWGSSLHSLWKQSALLIAAD